MRVFFGVAPHTTYCPASTWQHPEETISSRQVRARKFSSGQSVVSFESRLSCFRLNCFLLLRKHVYRLNTHRDMLVKTLEERNRLLLRLLTPYHTTPQYTQQKTVRHTIALLFCIARRAAAAVLSFPYRVHLHSDSNLSNKLQLLSFVCTRHTPRHQRVLQT
jgi:hypothetical protein